MPWEQDAVSAPSLNSPGEPARDSWDSKSALSMNFTGSPFRLSFCGICYPELFIRLKKRSEKEGLEPSEASQQLSLRLITLRKHVRQPLLTPSQAICGVRSGALASGQPPGASSRRFAPAAPGLSIELPGPARADARRLLRAHAALRPTLPGTTRATLS